MYIYSLFFIQIYWYNLCDVCVCVYMYVYIYIYICVCVCVSVYVGMYVCIYIHTLPFLRIFYVFLM